MKRYAIIVAGGRGQRMKSNVPKQFLELNQKPVLMHTIEKFYSASSSIHIVVVLPKSHHGAWNTLCEKHQFIIPTKYVKADNQISVSEKWLSAL